MRPRPQRLRQEGIVPHIRIDLGAQLRDESEGTIPSGLSIGVVENDESARRQWLIEILLQRSHGECGRERRQPAWGRNLFILDMRVVRSVSQAEQCRDEGLGRCLLIHDCKTMRRYNGQPVAAPLSGTMPVAR